VSGVQALKSALAAEVRHGRTYEVSCLSELHDVLFDSLLLLRLYLHPARIGIQIAEFGVESLHEIRMGFNIVPKRLPILLPLALVFFGILLLFAVFVLGLRDAGMDSRPVLVIVGAKKFRDVDDIIRGKFLDEIASGQIDPVVRCHPALKLGRYSHLRDEVIEIQERFGALGLFAYIGETPRQQVKRHFAHGFHLAARRPHIGRELYGASVGRLRIARLGGNRHQGAKHAPKNSKGRNSHVPDASRSNCEQRELRAADVRVKTMPGLRGFTLADGWL
jgi:hypothetical protein